MATSDAIQHLFIVGEVVNVPCTVTAVGGTTAKPTLTLQTKYEGFDGSKDTLADTLDSIQVIKDM